MHYCYGYHYLFLNLHLYKHQLIIKMTSIRSSVLLTMALAFVCDTHGAVVTRDRRGMGTTSGMNDMGKLGGKGGKGGKFASTQTPTTSPTASPTVSPTTSPTQSPSASPTMSPTQSPSTSPTMSPTQSPSISPTASPTQSPSTQSCASLYPTQETCEYAGFTWFIPCGLEDYECDCILGRRARLRRC
jgi:hypothetical protein